MHDFNTFRGVECAMDVFKFVYSYGINWLWLLNLFIGLVHLKAISNTKSTSSPRMVDRPACEASFPAALATCLMYEVACAASATFADSPIRATSVPDFAIRATVASGSSLVISDMIFILVER